MSVESSAESVGRYYDEWTEHYRSAFGETFQACRPKTEAGLHRYLLERSGIQDGERILDAGCGLCGPSRFFAAHTKIKIDAITVSARQVAISKGLVGETALVGQINVHLADYHRLPSYFAPETFDRVVYLESLSHAHDQAAALQGAYSVLRPGGVIYIKDFFEKQCEDSAETARVREVAERVDRTFSLRTPRLLETIGSLESAGFQRVMVERVGFLSDNAAWEIFDRTHRFDLYGGREACEWCTWHELKFQRPFV